jgi:chromatin structure-remodeling complex subunit RSC3/30
MAPNAASNTPATPFPRSEVIQNLSVFASLLETALHIRDGNYGIARRGLDAIRNILDRVLSAEDCDEPHQPRHSSQREKQQLQLQQYKIIPDAAMARFASPSAPSADQFPVGSVTHQQQQEISASQQQQQQQSVMMQENTPITTSYTASPSTNPEALGSTDGSYNTVDNFLPLDFMTWLDSFDWAQESLLNYS